MYTSSQKFRHIKTIKQHKWKYMNLYYVVIKKLHLVHKLKNELKFYFCQEM